MRLIFLSFVLSLIALAAAPEAAGVQVSFDRAEQDEAREAMRRGEIMNYGKIRRRAEVRLGGRLVGARLRRTNQGWIYEVRMLKETGKVEFAVLNAKTGERMKRRGEK